MALHTGNLTGTPSRYRPGTVPVSSRYKCVAKTVLREHGAAYRDDTGTLHPVWGFKNIKAGGGGGGRGDGGTGGEGGAGRSHSIVCTTAFQTVCALVRTRACVRACVRSCPTWEGGTTNNYTTLSHRVLAVSVLRQLPEFVYFTSAFRCAFNYLHYCTVP